MSGADQNDKNVIEDESGDEKYFVVTQRLVWALCSDPYEYIFWCIVKDIAGKKRQCIISTPDLAILTMMSTGKAHKCREGLIGKNLLNGKLIRDPGYPQPVWHLTIPDLWKANIEWSESHPTIKDRLVFKIQQAEETKREKGRVESPEEEKELSCGESYQELSCGEKGLSPGEKGLSPGERKNSIKEDLKRNKEDLSTPPVFFKLIEHFRTQLLDCGSQTDRNVYKKYIAPLSWGMRANGTVVLCTQDADSAAWLQGRMGSTFERAFNGFPELAGAEVIFVAEK